MSGESRRNGPTALVLQGGGALGAYELGAARRLYGQPSGEGTVVPSAPVFVPAVISGVSIGAIAAALLARPKGGNAIAALDSFWREVAVIGWPFPPIAAKFAAVFGNPRFFMPRTDYLDMANWTSFFDTAPLRRTLAKLVDVEALAQRGAVPRLILSATDIAAGQITYFDSAAEPLTLDHVMASASLPPFFPATPVGGRDYWDGGLFDNTPLGPVIDALLAVPGDDRTIIVVNLFPNAGRVPFSMREVGRRMLNLLFANKSREDLVLAARFNDVARLMQALEAALPADSPIRDLAAYRAVRAANYQEIPRLVQITRSIAADDVDAIDFTRDGIEQRAGDGWRGADAALKPLGW